MITSLARIISHFPGAANRARCTAHIVNLVTKIILRQFDAKKRSNLKNTDNTNDNDLDANDESHVEDLTALSEGLDREEQEIADDEDDEMSGNVEADLEEIEEALKEEVSEVAKKVKPIQRVLFKVRRNSLTHFSHY